jgi:hypothetical protein
MSLVGSLEDLGLGDILQIVSLSRKSGLLLLRSDEGDGRIVFNDGLVRAAYVKGEPDDLRTLLVPTGFVDADEFDRALETARASGLPPEEVVAHRTGVSVERIDSLRREHVERAVLRMFTWRVGEFSFEVRDELEPRDRELALRAGINAQYLTMEATRLGDEGRDAASSTGGEGLEADEPFLLSGEGDAPVSAALSAPGDAPVSAARSPVAAPAPPDSREVLAMATAGRHQEASPDADAGARTLVDEELGEDADAGTFLDEELDEDADSAEAAAGLPEEHPGAASLEAEARQPVLEPQPRFGVDAQPQPVAAPAAAAQPQPVAAPAAAAQPQPVAAPAAAARPAAGAALASAGRPARAAAAESASPLAVPLVVIDPELRALEWTKAALAGLFARVHIFQHSEGGIGRIRQYLARGEVPTVLVSARAPADSLCGSSDVAELVRRLRAQAPRMPIVVVHDFPLDPRAQLDAADAVIARPPCGVLADRRRRGEVEAAAAALRAALSPWARRSAGGGPEPAAVGAAPAAVRAPAAPTPAGRDELRRLKDLSARLRDPSTRGEVLNLVLEFASECFRRVAVFMVRDDVAVGLAQRALPSAGGPDDAALRALRIPLDECAWFRSVVSGGEAICTAPADAGDRRLAALLGGQLPPEAYVAPIESGGRVAALLYADNLPQGEPLRDATALAIVLHEAGLALDRALLERALAEFDG